MVELGLSFCIEEWVVFFFLWCSASVFVLLIRMSLTFPAILSEMTCWTLIVGICSALRLLTPPFSLFLLLSFLLWNSALFSFLFVPCLALHHFSNVGTISIFVATGRSKKGQHWEDSSFWKRCLVCPSSIMCFYVFPGLFHIFNFLKIFWSKLSFWYHNKYSAISVLVSI